MDSLAKKVCQYQVDSIEKASSVLSEDAGNASESSLTGKISTVISSGFEAGGGLASEIEDSANCKWATESEVDEEASLVFGQEIGSETIPGVKSFNRTMSHSMWVILGLR